MGGEEARKESHEEEDVEIVRIVFGTLPTIIKSAEGMIVQMIKTITDPARAENLAKGVATLYKTLKEAGLPEDEIKEIVREYVKSTLEASKLVKEIVETLTSKLRGMFYK